MVEGQLGAVLRRVRQLFGLQTGERLTDGQLLDRFASQQDEGAFEALVQRHGPMTLGVCRRVLNEVHDAEDVFQATFLVLARKAASIRRQESVAKWLYGVAYRLALKAREKAARRKAHERQAGKMATEHDPEPTWKELWPVLDEELNRLPDRYRAPLVLCYLDGKTQEEAARELGWPMGSMSWRLAQARDRLRERLLRRGLPVAAGLVAAGLPDLATTAAVPVSLVHSTVLEAQYFAAGKTALVGSAAAISLAEGMVQSMNMLQMKIIAVLVLFVGLVGLGTAVALHGAATADSSRLTERAVDPPSAAAPNEEEKTPPGSPDAPAASTYPRRLLAIIPANYPFANPINYGTGDRSLNVIVKQLGEILHIPEDQVVILSDKAVTPLPPIRALIESNVARFLDSCRNQDRIVLLFVGHAVEVEGKGYLLPLEGEEETIQTLIPLEWLYDRLTRCKARQKVLMLDVCRFDPARGEERGKVQKMGEKFDAMLQKPPEGVQVLTACVAGQHSFEIGGLPGLELQGGVMLNQVSDIKSKGGIKGTIQRPEDSLPMSDLTSLLKLRTRAVSKAFLLEEQTPRLSGQEADNQVAYDPKLPPAPPFQLELAGNFKNGVASEEDIRAILSVTANIPPARKSETIGQIDFNALPPYPIEVVAAYKDDGKETAFRAKILEALDALKRKDASFQDVFLAPPNNPQQQNQFKTGLEEIQKSAGLLMFKLDTVLEELDEMKAQRKDEPKLWQANYDYVRARLAARIASIFEYNARLGDLRKDFPPRDPNRHDGWRLVPSAKLSDRDAEKYAKKAAQCLETITREHAGTPWELLAKREKFVSLGLEWQPHASPKAPPPRQ